MHTFLGVLYQLLKLIVKTALRFYYSKITVVNRPTGRLTQPCIVISNHPSTLLDPFNAVVHIPRIVFFLANAGLFKHPVAGWLLSRLFCIPVERHQDTGGKPLDNKATFAKAIEHLKKGCLYIAPEGSSFMERRLRKLKTGTARIALLTESVNDWNLGLTILPVGLNYSAPDKFRSHILTIYGEPVRVVDFKNDWEKDEIEAVRKLTDHLAERLSELTIDTKNDFEDALLNHLEALAQTEHPLSPAANFQRTKNIQKQMLAWKVIEPEAYASFAKKLFAHFEKLKLLNFSDAAFKLKIRPSDFLTMAALSPFAVFGYVSHFLPCFFSKKINDLFNDDLAYVPTFKFVAGVVFFPLFYVLQTLLVALIFQKSWLTWMYVLSLVPTGLAAEWFLKKLRPLLEKWRLNNMAKKEKNLLEDLLEKRAFLIKKELTG